MAILQCLCAILFLFFVNEVASIELNYYHQINQITRGTFNEYDVKNITYLDFRGCNVEKVSSSAFAGMTSLKTILLTYNNIEYLPEYVFRDTEDIDFIQMISNKLEYIPKYLLLKLRKLTYLNLANNLILSIEEGTFDGNIKLKTLSLKSNRLTVIPTGAFSALKELDNLDISDNRIYKIEKSALPNSQNLRTFMLYSNKLRSLEGKYVTSLTTSLLDRNPWFCDCKLKEVHAKWKANFVSQGWMPICDAPKKLHNAKWINLSSDDFTCEKITLNLYPDKYEITSKVGSSLSLNCLVKGGAKVSDVSWTYKNNNVIDRLQDVGRPFSVQFNSGNQNNVAADVWYNLTIYNVRSSDDGIYKCVAKDGNNIYEIEKRVLVASIDAKGIDVE